MSLKKIFVLVVATFAIVSCKKNRSSQQLSGNAPGDIVSYELIGTYNTDRINRITTADLEKFMDGTTMPYPNFEGKLAKAKHPVKLYKVKYRSVVPEKNNQRTVASGLVAIPDVASNELSMISYQHGTVFGKNDVPSQPDTWPEVGFMISQFASQGYVLIAADYFGLGDNTGLPNSYFVRMSTEQACLDMYKASRNLMDILGLKINKFFISGWSQGAYNTMLFLRRLEAEQIPVSGAFTAAAPVDPLFFINRGLFQPREFDAPYQGAALGNMIFAIEYYRQLKGISSKYISKDYYQTAKDFYDFKTDFISFFTSTSDTLSKFFNPEFFSSAAKGVDPFWQVLGESQAYKWLSPTPLRAYYGMRDEAVPDNIARLAVDYMKSLGKTNGAAFNAGEMADHRSTYMFSLIHSKTWIDSLNNGL